MSTHQLHCLNQIQVFTPDGEIENLDVIMTNFQQSMDRQLIAMAMLLNLYFSEHVFEQPCSLEHFFNQFTKQKLALVDETNIEFLVNPETGELLDHKYIEALYLVNSKVEMNIISFELIFNQLFESLQELNLVDALLDPKYAALMDKLEEYNHTLFQVVSTFSKWMENGETSISSDMFEQLNESYVPRTIFGSELHKKGMQYAL